MTNPKEAEQSWSGRPLNHAATDMPDPFPPIPEDVINHYGRQLGQPATGPTLFDQHRPDINAAQQLVFGSRSYPNSPFRRAPARAQNQQTTAAHPSETCASQPVRAGAPDPAQYDALHQPTTVRLHFAAQRLGFGHLMHDLVDDDQDWLYSRGRYASERETSDDLSHMASTRDSVQRSPEESDAQSGHFADVQDGPLENPQPLSEHQEPAPSVADSVAVADTAQGSPGDTTSPWLQTSQRDFEPQTSDAEGLTASERTFEGESSQPHGSASDTPVPPTPTLNEPSTETREDHPESPSNAPPAPAATQSSGAAPDSVWSKDLSKLKNSKGGKGAFKTFDPQSEAREGNNDGNDNWDPDSDAEDSGWPA